MGVSPELSEKLKVKREKYALPLIAAQNYKVEQKQARH
jgi:hypothetical protein